MKVLVAVLFSALVALPAGAEDGFINPETIGEFQQTLSAADVDWQMIYYGGAVHSFSNPEADKVGNPGIGYDEKAAKRSWQAMMDFFDETLQ